MSTICWMSLRPSRYESQRFGPISHLMSRHGMSVHWLQIPTERKVPFSLDNWLAQGVPADTKAIFFSEKDVDLLKEMITGLKSSFETRVQRLPIFWIYSEMDLHLIERVTQLGVDDFFHVSQNPNDILARLKLRCQEAQREKGTVVGDKKDHLKSEIGLQQREEFLSVCAHDLRSPLGIIQSSLSVLMDAKNPAHNLNEQSKELLSRAQRQATHALALVNDLLDVMSLEQGLKPVYEIFKLEDVLLEMKNDYQDKAKEKNLTIHYENDIRDWRVLADPERIRQLMQNLLTNAIKFSSDGKNIYIRVSSLSGRRKSDPPYPMIVVSVRDEGQGIPATEIQKIFDKFSQMKDYSRSEGRGLGLSVAKQITTLHNGNLWVESEKDKGSNFSFLLPYVISNLQPTKNPKHENRVLVAEPSTERQERFYRQLEAWGYELDFVKDGVEAVAMLHFRTHGVFIMSPDLSKLDSIEVLGMLKKELADLDATTLVGLEDGLILPADKEKAFRSRILKLPLSKQSFQDTIRKIRAAGTTPIKKVA